MLEWFLDNGSNHAPSTNFAMDLVNLIVVIAFVLTNAALVYFIIRYRRRSDNDVTSRKANSHTIEVIWTTIPSIVFLGLYVVGLQGFMGLRAVAADAREINVWAKQWAWEFQYPASLREDTSKKSPLKSYNKLYLEANRPVKLIMKSHDVIHSFSVPDFRVKEDVVGHIYTYTTFTPLISPRQKAMTADQRKERSRLTEAQQEKIPQMADECLNYEPGTCATYNIFCTEYCGNDHSYMLAKAIVLTPEHFKAKMAELEEASNNISPDMGQQIYNSAGCKSCHSIDGSRVVGPSFKGLYGTERPIEGGTKVVADENYIRESILNPGAKIHEGFPNLMPPQDLSDEQIESVILFFKTLK
ncbi:MAG: c-type cytochrome [Leptospiraceae bacterium]|nr:c-type cytochrome [Leptospiraceae bacterium]MCB1303925.1 c-type cytochrome [Leptospiraceae bacterium]